MKTLRQSLIDYEMAQLQAIANCRVVPLNTTDQAEAINQLAEALLSPVATAIALDDLAADEKEALEFLLKQGGQIELPRFTRQYGTIRHMGPARLERERPWESPANPTEALWYRGLIFTAFQVTPQGGQEIIYIPSDMLPLLSPTITTPKSLPPKTLKVAQATTPTVIINGQNRLRENFFSLLVYLQTTPVKLQANHQIPAATRQAMTGRLLPPLTPTFTPADELDFLLHLGQRVELIKIARGHLRPERDPVRSWLQADPAEQNRLLQNGWRADPTWNDLWRVPGLMPQPTGWENSPLRARSKILGYLEQLDTPADDWVSIDSFVTTIKSVDPDFQRPNGDYESWYIKDAAGNFLMGFEHWDQIEGGLIRYVLTHILLLLGVVELGSPSETSMPTSFRLTPAGRAFLAGQPFHPQLPARPAHFRADNNFRVRVPGSASLYDRFQLARFSELDSREANRVIYQITRASISRAIKNGVTADQMMAFLTRVTNNQIPLKVVETIRTWSTRYATVQLEQATLLHLKEPQLAAEIQHHPQLGPLLGEKLNPTTILVPADNVSQVRRLLIELGYLE